MWPLSFPNPLREKEHFPGMTVTCALIDSLPVVLEKPKHTDTHRLPSTTTTPSPLPTHTRVLFHQDKLRENEDALSTKQQERAQLDIAFRDLTAEGFTPTPSPVRTPVQSNNEGDEGVGGEEEAFPDAAVEQDSGGCGAVQDSARPVVGTAQKRRCLDSAQVLNEVVVREIAQLSKEDALRFQASFSQQAERANDVEMGTLEILRLQQEAHDRDSVLLGTQG